MVALLHPMLASEPVTLALASTRQALNGNCRAWTGKDLEEAAFSWSKLTELVSVKLVAGQ